MAIFFFTTYNLDMIPFRARFFWAPPTAKKKEATRLSRRSLSNTTATYHLTACIKAGGRRGGEGKVALAQESLFLRPPEGAANPLTPGGEGRKSEKGRSMVSPMCSFPECCRPDHAGASSHKGWCLRREERKEKKKRKKGESRHRPFRNLQFSGHFSSRIGHKKVCCGTTVIGFTCVFPKEEQSYVHRPGEVKKGKKEGEDRADPLPCNFELSAGLILAALLQKGEGGKGED